MLKSILQKLKNKKISKLELKLFFTYQLWIYLFHIGSICLCCWLTNRWIEGIAFIFAHCVLRYTFNRQYHSENHCLALTTFIIWSAIPITLPIAYSLIFSVPVAFVVCWIGDTVQEKIVLRKVVKKLEQERLELQKMLEDKQDYSFDVDTCTEQQLVDRCKELHLSEENTELAIEFFIKKTKQSELADKYFIQEKSITTRKKRLKAKLNKI